MKINHIIAESAGNIGSQIKAAYKKIYNAGDDAVEFMYYDSPIFAQYWDEYEGDLDSIIAEVDPQELQIILDELTAAAEDQGLAEAAAGDPYAFGDDDYMDLIQDMIDNNRRNMSPSRKPRVLAATKRYIEQNGGVFDPDVFEYAYDQIIEFSRGIDESQGVAEAGVVDTVKKGAKKAWDYATEPIHQAHDIIAKDRAKNIAKIRKNKQQGMTEAGEWTRTPSGDYINMHTGVRSSSMPKKSKPRAGNRMSDMTVGSPKIVHKNGRAVGEIGVDHDPSPGQGPFYMKHYETNTWYSGYDTKQEALADLKHVVAQMNEGIGADTAKLGGIAALGIAGGLAGNYVDQQQPKVEIGGKIAFVEPAHSRVPDSAMTLTGKDGKTYRVWATKGTVQSPQRYHAVPVQDVKEGAEERKRNALWAQITSYEKRAKETKNDIKKQHLLKMADELRGKLPATNEEKLAESFDELQASVDALKGLE